MIRFLLLSILLTIVYRAAASLWSGIVRGLQGNAGRPAPRGTSRRVSEQGVRMSRDPMCGTFVVPESAVALSTSDGQRIYFCSAACRDQYRASAPPSRAAHGQTA